MAPIEGYGRSASGGAALPAPEELPGFTTLPAGWPGEVPELRTGREIDVWGLVHAACVRHGIPGEALTMYHVLWEESRLGAGVSSPCGRYHGIGQFTHSTFRESVARMRRLGLIWGDDEWTPFDAAQAIEVMAFMWSRGGHDHWGPYRRVVRRLSAVAEAASRN